jgi:hypothetical protein
MRSPRLAYPPVVSGFGDLAREEQPESVCRFMAALLTRDDGILIAPVLDPYDASHQGLAFGVFAPAAARLLLREVHRWPQCPKRCPR